MLGANSPAAPADTSQITAIKITCIMFISKNGLIKLLEIISAITHFEVIAP